jgi:hypothetical protein
VEEVVQYANEIADSHLQSKGPLILLVMIATPKGKPTQIRIGMHVPLPPTISRQAQQYSIVNQKRYPAAYK